MCVSASTQLVVRYTLLIIILPVFVVTSLTNSKLIHVIIMTAYLRVQVHFFVTSPDPTLCEGKRSGDFWQKGWSK